MYKLANIAIALLTALRSARDYTRELRAAPQPAPDAYAATDAELRQLASLVNDHYEMAGITEFLLPVKHYTDLPPGNKAIWEAILRGRIRYVNYVSLTSDNLVRININIDTDSEES